MGAIVQRSCTNFLFAAYQLRDNPGVHCLQESPARRSAAFDYSIRLPDSRLSDHCMAESFACQRVQDDRNCDCRLKVRVRRRHR
jgi:hypothetical protein